MHKLLTERPTSGFPISIGSALSLETLFNPVKEAYDPSRIIPDRPSLDKYSLYVFNINTLLRNLINCIPYVSLREIKASDILDTLLEEIEFITHFFSSNNLNIKFYVNSYSYIKNTYDAKKLRNATTDKQIFIDTLTSYCLNKLKKEDEVSHFTKDIHYDKNDSVLLFTHVPWDLLSYSNFINLELLESNTGVIKTRKSWNSKYYPIPNKDMSFLPFFEYLLVTFGDHVLFHPDTLEKRLSVYNQMKTKHVHPLMNISDLIFK